MLKLVQCEFAKLKEKKSSVLCFVRFLFPIPITFLMATPRMLEKYPNKSVLFDGLFNMVMGYGVIFSCRVSSVSLHECCFLWNGTMTLSKIYAQSR